MRHIHSSLTCLALSHPILLHRHFARALGRPALNPIESHCFFPPPSAVHTTTTSCIVRPSLFIYNLKWCSLVLFVCLFGTLTTLVAQSAPVSKLLSMIGGGGSDLLTCSLARLSDTMARSHIAAWCSNNSSSLVSLPCPTRLPSSPYVHAHACVRVRWW